MSKGPRTPPVVRQAADVALRLVIILLAASLCSYVTINQPLLRLIYDAVADYADFLVNLTSYWRNTHSFVLTAYQHSIFVVTAAIGLAMLIGIPAGLLAGMRPTSRLSLVVRVASSLGTITPSFLLAMFILVFFVLYVLPATGIRFVLVSSQAPELDPRRLVPIALTLSVRSLAYFVTVTAAAAERVISDDYVRTARGKGLRDSQVLLRHIWPNVLPDILHAIPVALIFSMSSLPIVEFVFNWPGLGRQLLFSMVMPPRPGISKAALVSFLFASVGFTYVVVVFLTDLTRRLLYPPLEPMDEQ